MKITVRVPRFGSSAEPKLLVRFVIQRCREVAEPPPVLVALALAAISRDHDYHNRLKEAISSSEEAESILGMCEKVFMPALGWFQDRKAANNSEGEEEYTAPDEAACKHVLRYALSDGKKMLSDGAYGFVNVFEFLLRAGLQPYSFRLYQFEAVRETFKDDPENLLRRGIEIISAAVGSPQDEN
jgi:hypothetical protein